MKATIRQPIPRGQHRDRSFVHTNASSDFSLVWLGIELEADFSGYDLGLVEPENRTTVAAQVPEEGSKDASSFIVFESTFENSIRTKSRQSAGVAVHVVLFARRQAPAAK